MITALRAQETSQSFTDPYLTTMSEHVTCGSAMKVNPPEGTHFPIDLSPIKLTLPHSRGLSLCGRHFKDKRKGNLPSTGLHYSKCHPKPTPFIFKGKKKYKNSKQKEQSGYSYSLYTKKFTSLSI